MQFSSVRTISTNAESVGAMEFDMKALSVSLIAAHSLAVASQCRCNSSDASWSSGSSSGQSSVIPSRASRSWMLFAQSILAFISSLRDVSKGMPTVCGVVFSGMGARVDLNRDALVMVHKAVDVVSHTEDALVSNCLAR